ncbi:type II secretion system F family protein [Halobacillus yeomjeoni]|uniref:Type II secretion system F family protein n=1 Tax=Halobacillus yeomjeoni TaxID=311194 RepID=A0A931HTK0_9BACI|nr:type II secretion system F family protein [Halobacillus yeomjeoni]MBH0229191.1 type II secretion system F family protein [Halobacillus yeomjeoni]
MKWFLLAMILFSTFLFFSALFQMIFFSDKRMKKRLERYLDQDEKKGFDRKKFTLALQIQLAQKNIKDRMMTKEKNSKLEKSLSRAGMALKPEEYVLLQWLSICMGGGLFYLVTGQFIFIFVGAVLGFLFPKWYLLNKQKARYQKFNEGLPDMLSTIVGALRAGFSFPQALKTVVDESHNPIKDEMETVLREMKYGSSMEESLHRLYDRMPSEDLDLMIQAILIQRQVGGNLATVLEKIMDTIRERTKIQRQIKTLTAQGRLSGIVIGLLPIILALVLFAIEPEYIGTLFTHPVGIALLIAGAISGSIGFFLIRKLTTIEV